MKRRSILLLLAAVVLLWAGRPSPAQTKTHHVVFAVTSGDEVDWHITLGNIRNLLNGLAPDPVEIEVVAYAQGLGLVKHGSAVAEDVAALQTAHVRFVACQNSMRMQHVEVKDLLSGVGTVPSGAVEVVTRQEQGWAYIKGGR
ncbi:MAG: DsrE family protein [Acidobacteriota bacterium]|nr:DsrE family protein [Acidobacteriota bacterium]